VAWEYARNSRGVHCRIGNAISLAESLSLRYPLRTPFSIRTVLCVGWPSSSTFSEATAPRHGAVVNDRAFLASDAFADKPGKSGCLFTIKIGFQSMADRFVQEHAGPAGTKHNFHFTAGLRERPVCKIACRADSLGEIFGSLITEEKNPALPTAAACAAASGIAVCLGDAAHVQASERLGIFSKGSIGTHH